MNRDASVTAAINQANASLLTPWCSELHHGDLQALLDHISTLEFEVSLLERAAAQRRMTGLQEAFTRRAD